LFLKIIHALNLTYIRGMSGFRLVFAVLLCLFVSNLAAQFDVVRLNVTVIDSFTAKPLTGVSVLDPKLGTNVGTDSKGFAAQTIGKKDTLYLFFPGYKAKMFSVTDSPMRAEYKLHLTLEPFATGMSRAVIIRAPKTLEQIEADRKNLGITPKELERPIIQPFSSPISALYDILSARAKEREKLKKQIAENDRDKVFKELLNYYNEKKIIDLPEDHYDNFIKFCNLPADYLKNHSDYEIMKSIKTLYEKYGRLSGLIK
jgi:hypothetical protein